MTITPDPTGIQPPPSLAPTPYHRWDWVSRTFVPDLPAAKAAVRTQVDAHRAYLAEQPVTFRGVEFDAGAVSRERLLGVILRYLRGGGLPAGWIGWRDAHNQIQWSSVTESQIHEYVKDLFVAMHDREQHLLVQAWAKKDQIDAMLTVEEVLAFNVTEGWW